MTDRELIQGIIRRDNEVFKKVVDLFEKHVIRTCYSLVHDDQDARDIAQEVFIEILDSAGSFRGKAKFSSWIYRIAINKSLNHLKLQKRRQFLTRIGLRSANSGETYSDIPADNGQLAADEAMIEKEIRSVLHLTINKLPVNQRIAFTLCKYEKLSYQEIAEVMDVTVSSVESLLHRAKQNLQKQLAHYYRENI